MGNVLLAHAGEARAEKLARRLTALGYAVKDELRAGAPVSPLSRRKIESQVDAAEAVLLLWSRNAKGAPCLLAAADRAKAKGKLTVIRLDAAVPPAGLAKRAPINLSGWTGRDSRALQRLLAALPTSAPGKAGRKTAPKASQHAASAAKRAPQEGKRRQAERARSGARGPGLAAMLGGGAALAAAAAAAAAYAISQGFTLG